MTTRAFFVTTLAVPILVGLLGFVTPWLKIFQAALLFGGIPYIPFACLLGVLIRRAPTKQRLVVMSVVAPIAFAACDLAFVSVVGSTTSSGELTFAENLAQLAPVAVYSLAFGYFYVLLAWCLWFVARKLNLVADDIAA